MILEINITIFLSMHVKNDSEVTDFILFQKFCFFYFMLHPKSVNLDEMCSRQMAFFGSEQRENKLYRLMNALRWHCWAVQFSAISMGHQLQKLTRWNGSKTLAPFCWYRWKLEFEVNFTCRMRSFPASKPLALKDVRQEKLEYITAMYHTFYWRPEANNLAGLMPKSIVSTISASLQGD